jgi:hypothetical protein
MGAVRDGAALLAGLVVCGRCGHRMSVHYDGDSGGYTYECAMLWNSYGQPRCQHVSGPCLDRFVSQQVLWALEPAALELSLAATERLQQERDELERLWQQRLERAGYAVERAARQYHLVEPEHRLVARSLEREWEAKLAARQRLEEEYHRFLRQQPRVLSSEERAAIRQLAADIPSLWDAPTTMAADRKEIIRQVVERVVIAVQGTSERVRVSIHWLGGGQTDGEAIRPVARVSDLSYYAELCERVRALDSQGLSAKGIVARLAEEGYHPAREGERFGVQVINELEQRLGLRPKHRRIPDRAGLGPNEWWLGEVAQRLGMPRSSLGNWLRTDKIRARREEQSGRWILWADEAELERLRLLRERSIPDELRQRWTREPTPDERGRETESSGGEQR